LYEFVGRNPRLVEGELFTRCYPCHCKVCRDPSSVNTEYRKCPNLSQVGGWCKAACHRSRGAVQRAATQRDDVEAFAKSMKANALYAAAGDPKNLERGGRPYWLLRTAGKAFKSSGKLRAFAHPKAPTIKAKTWVVKAQWYLSTALDHRAKRHAYKLLNEYHFIKVESIIQEPGLDFARGFRATAGCSAESTLGDDAHTRIMGHNFASYM
jgi:hypothetical protein